jgi:hypothetical protein
MSEKWMPVPPIPPFAWWKQCQWLVLKADEVVRLVGVTQSL